METVSIVSVFARPVSLHTGQLGSIPWNGWFACGIWRGRSVLHLQGRCDYRAFRSASKTTIR